MEALEALGYMVMFWRAGLATLVALVAAVFLAAVVPWFTGLYGLLLVFLGFGLGLFWEGAASKPYTAAKSLPQPSISWPTAALSLWFFGAVIGGVATAVVGSPWVAAAFLFVCQVAAYVSIRASGKPAPVHRFLLSGAALQLGLVSVLAASHALAEATPNQSLKRSANGMSPGPRVTQGIVAPRGPGATPLSPA